jgi:UPF0755 protein
MSRHGGRDTGDIYDDGTWLPGGFADGAAEDAEAGRTGLAGADADTRPPGATRTSAGGDSGAWSASGPPWEEAGPPWEQPGWDGDGGSAPGLDAADLAGRHPSGPLPVLPPLPEEGDWPDPPAALGYPDGPGDEPGYPGNGHHWAAGGHGAPAADDTYGGYPGDHDDDTGYGYPADTDAGYDPGYREPDYPTDGGGLADTGTGYGLPAYDDGRFAADAGGYPEDDDYPAEDDEYPEYREPAAGHRDRDDDHGHPDRRDWYEDVDEQQDWPEDDEDDFLPGLGAGTRHEAEGRPGDGGTSRRGGRLRGKGPGRQRADRSGPGGPGPGKRKRGMRRLAPWLALSVVLALLVGAGAGYLYVYRTYLHPADFSGPGTGSLVVHIYPGDTASVVGQRLQRAGVVASARAFENAAKSSGQGSALEPGLYRVRLHMQASLAFALLLRPSSRVQTRVTIREGLRLSQIIATLGRATGNPGGYQRAIKDVAALNLPSFAGGKPEGYLFPATYDIQPNTPPIKVLQSMVTRFGQEAASVSLPAAAAHAELTQAEVITVASLIQAEGGRLSYYPKIARVIYNRLNANPQIPLQLDSTVLYAVHAYGIRASAQQIKVKSPYNTYLHKGLPPGPIDSPGNAAIQAALHPAHGTWMYFVTVDPKTGLTKFTSSFAQFQQWEAELTANLAKGR